MLAYDSKKSGHVVAPFVTNKLYYLILIKSFRKKCSYTPYKLRTENTLIRLPQLGKETFWLFGVLEHIKHMHDMKGSPFVCFHYLKKIWSWVQTISLKINIVWSMKGVQNY